MLFEIDSNRIIDTDRDLTAEERHIVQKLLGWQGMVNSLAEFREKQDRTLQMGWNDSGPITKSEPLTLIIEFLEKELKERITAQ